MESAIEEAKDAPSRRNLYTKLGLAHWILGNYPQAIAALESGSDPDANLFLGQIYLERDNPRAALGVLEKAKAKDETLDSACALLEAMSKLGEAEKALKELEKLAGKNGDSPEVHYQMGLAKGFMGDYEGALESFEKALQLDETHTKSAFRLGHSLALRGHEEEALSYYQKCLKAGPATVGVLMNLGLLYEDARQYEKAVKCYERILKADATNERARLYLKDALASLDMYYDEEEQNELEKRVDLLNMDVAEFELSVRCHTALERIGITTVGALVTKTEEELLECRNFGETSLQELKAVLAQRGLRLGMSPNEFAVETAAKAAPPGEQDVLDKLVADLDLSVRARRCMERLGIVTLRDLTEKTERELLSGKNFGRTSLKEIKDKLAAFGVKLAED
jgi:DNA-directed RNA polymerase subunit alpha